MYGTVELSHLLAKCGTRCYFCGHLLKTQSTDMDSALPVLTKTLPYKLESALCGDANPRRLQRQSC